MKKIFNFINRLFDKHGEFGYPTDDDDEEPDIDPYIGIMSGKKGC